MTIEQLIDNLADEMRPVRAAPAPVWVFLRWCILTVAYISLMVTFMGMRPDLMQKIHTPLFAAELEVLGGIIASSLLAGALLAFPDMYQKKWLTLLPGVMFLLFLYVLFMEYLADVPPAPLPRHNSECLRCISILALMPGAFILYHIRKFASTHYYMAGTIAILAAFAIGAMVLRLSEPTNSITHLLEWHYLPMIGAGIIGLVLGRLYLKW